MLTTIEKTKKLNSATNEYEGKIEVLEIKVDAQQERYLELMTSNIRLQEKASDALALARETKAISNGNVREVNASLLSIRSEVKSQIKGVDDRMKALQRATTNPLGR